MAPENERKECLICGQSSVVELHSTDALPLAVLIHCPKCGRYAVSYSLWHRMMLSGWNGMIMKLVRRTLMDRDIRTARLGNAKPPLLMSVSDADETTLHTSTKELWDGYVVEE